MTVHVVVEEHGQKAGLDNPGGEELLSVLGGKEAGLPFFAFLDGHGGLIVNSMRPVEGQSRGTNIGFPAQPEEIDWFLAMLAKAVPEMPAAQSGLIGDWLRKHK